MSLVISEELVEASGLSEPELLLEIVMMLFQQNKISLGKAAHLAGRHPIAFQREMATRGICIHYEIEDFEQDLESLREQGWQ
ncbi:UPF0175 family protein [Laspinema sp. D1]|uniref:UPF0175 family protein n=1 Tax=Laspinema palackyanum D2a TaxID=2953684 RepID=A0ABT2MWZ0_9CYAN|nr:UPF0175 family protein [Laspinema sp. D2a]